ncbi:ABC transporter ATP-binding protein [Halopenitus salinus]|uniref:ABC-type D-xylose/L-arabinose transporter n=1 Tax=Halopenitus salinus TaxID=1198295 RepID=A0ABD5UW18_9EURY
MAHLDVIDLSKEFQGEDGPIVAVEEMNLSIEKGEFIVLVGPSGCGKSTTLRCLAGLESPTEGDIQLNDRSVVDSPPMDRDMAMVFQNYALYPHMTARENMSFGLKMTTELSDEAIDQKVIEVAEMMGIKDLLGKKPSDISGGQQQRVALGRAIVREPEVFLMDEPLSNLDAKLRTEMRTELQNLQQTLDVTTIYVTHDQTEAMTMSDRIVILNKGKVQQVGTPLECYHEPTNRFVAGFIGSPSMNFFNVKLDGRTLVHPEFKYQISDSLFTELQEGNEFTLGIRPEDIKLTSQSTENSIPISVNVIEPMGDISYIYFDIGDNHVTASVSGEIQIQENTEVNILFPEEQLHLFDAQTGKAVYNRRQSPGDEVPLTS